MSVNCIKCVVIERTGPDLLCNECRKDSSFAAPPGLGGILELKDGWRLENGMPGGCSRLIRGDGVTAFYRYMDTTESEARLIQWAYQEGYKHGDTERQHKVKTILGLNAS